LIVNKLDVTPINFFLRIFFLFHLKNMLLIVHVQLESDWMLKWWGRGVT
jgi:hypothetical protein